MITPELITYIEERMQAGDSHEQIKKSLIASGWAEGDAIAGISQASTREPEMAIGSLTVDTPRKTPWLVMVLVLLAVAGGGYFYWQSRSSLVVSHTLTAPSTWTTHASTLTSPGFIVKHDPDWTLKELGSAVMFTISTDGSIIVRREIGKTTFSGIYNTVGADGKSELIKKDTPTIAGVIGQRTELLLAKGETYEGNIVRTELVTGGALWTVELIVNNSSIKSAAELKGYKEQYIKVLNSFQVQ